MLWKTKYLYGQNILVQGFRMRKLQIKELCNTSNTKFEIYFKAEKKVTLSQVNEYTTSMTFVHIFVYVLSTRLLIFMLWL